MNWMLLLQSEEARLMSPYLHDAVEELGRLLILLTLLTNIQLLSLLLLLLLAEPHAHGWTSMRHLEPTTGVILYSPNPASRKSLAHSFSLLSFPATVIIISMSNKSSVSIHALSFSCSPTTSSIIITFPPAVIASLHRLRIFRASSSFQLCSIHCTNFIS